MISGAYSSRIPGSKVEAIQENRAIQMTDYAHVISGDK